MFADSAKLIILRTAVFMMGVFKEGDYQRNRRRN